MPRPRFRMPLWSALAIAGAAYAARSVMRGFDFRLDMPIDLVVLALLAIVVGTVGYLRAQEAQLQRHDADAECHDEPDDR